MLLAKGQSRAKPRGGRRTPRSAARRPRRHPARRLVLAKPVGRLETAHGLRREYLCSRAGATATQRRCDVSATTPSLPQAGKTMVAVAVFYALTIPPSQSTKSSLMFLLRCHSTLVPPVTPRPHKWGNCGGGGAMRRYGSFLVRWWQIEQDEQRVSIRHVQSD